MYGTKTLQIKANSKAISIQKKKVESITLPDFKASYKTPVIKTARYQDKSRYIGQ
jgi:hypothetical protein